MSNRTAPAHDERAAAPDDAPLVVRHDLPEAAGPERVLVPGGSLEPPRTRSGEQLAEVFEEAVDRHPDPVAVDTGDARLTYRELDDRANRLAHHLRAGGTGPGRPVTIGCAPSASSSRWSRSGSRSRCGRCGGCGHRAWPSRPDRCSC
ncbi:AMP-binding protein [Pseudonocardia sp. NPDC046786]|uniref:AMP-binding protein n=1 Tax=Pseudonocardia sp. NPDC046786 TaxID=3155471 RepID=UPI0033EFFB80